MPMKKLVKGKLEEMSPEEEAQFVAARNRSEEKRTIRRKNMVVRKAKEVAKEKLLTQLLEDNLASRKPLPEVLTWDKERKR